MSQDTLGCSRQCPSVSRSNICIRSIYEERGRFQFTPVKNDNMVPNKHSRWMKPLTVFQGNLYFLHSVIVSCVSKSEINSRTLDRSVLFLFLLSMAQGASLPFFPMTAHLSIRLIKSHTSMQISLWWKLIPTSDSFVRAIASFAINIDKKGRNKPKMSTNMQVKMWQCLPAMIRIGNVGYLPERTRVKLHILQRISWRFL